VDSSDSVFTCTDRGVKRTIAVLERSSTLGELILQSIIADAGWPIWPLLFVSIVALALIFERLLALRGSRVCPPGLAAEARRMLRGNMLDGDALVKLGQSSSAGQIVATVLANRDKPLAEIRLNAEDTGAEVAHDLQRFLTCLVYDCHDRSLDGAFWDSGWHD